MVVFVLAICQRQSPGQTPLKTAQSPPNIVLIVSDDQGYNDLGFRNDSILTPNLDRLAQRGTYLTNFYVAWPACTPSRAALLTGRYPQRNGIYDMIRNEAPDYGHLYDAAEYAVSFERIGGMDEREVTIANRLQERGYATGIFGKWDLGSLKRYLPTSRGFDDFYGFVNTGIDYYTHERYGMPSMFRGERPTEQDRGTYATELFQREAVRFIDEHIDRQPFFLYLPFNAPHSASNLDWSIRSTVQAPERFKDLYPPVKEPFRTRTNARYGNPAQIVTPEARRRDYWAAVTAMDESIGKVMDLLEQQGEADNTIVIFLSDNGGGGGSDNSPLRGHKGDLWEGGIRVPCLVSWPAGGVAAGVTSDAFLTSLEVFPSLLAAASIEPQAEVALDGFDWWPNLRGENASPRTSMFWQRQDAQAARVGNWKWVRLGDSPAQLFDLATDIAEEHDLAAAKPDVAARLAGAFAAWQTEMNAAEPRGPFRDY